MITCPHCTHQFDPQVTDVDQDKFTPKKLIELYNEQAVKHKWQRVLRPGEKLKKSLASAIKELPELEMWQAVFRGWANDPFFSGTASNYSPNIETMIFKSRYMTFYNAGAEAPMKESVDDILAGFKSLQAGA